ncbi:MAG: hypothetical protein KatS3mg076_3068 [Candidatus Binatia bacterium]|nr:MAG: hypothetical protein KatS3mg076_3068 [Candidatus Binatia bacterium]
MVRTCLLVLVAGVFFPAPVSSQLNLQFFPGTPTEVARRPKAVAVADFNGDGIDDVAVASSGSNRVTVLISKGDGEFVQATAVTIGKGMRGIAAGDFNQDGNMDVIVATGSRNVFLLLGKGDGTLPTSRTVRRCCRGFGVATLDLDGVNGDDAVFSNPGSDDVSVLLNRGDATFGGEKRFRVGNRPEKVITADLDGDGILDVATLSTRGGGSEVTTLLGDSTGILRPVANFVAGRRSKTLTAGDFDGDGRVDIAAADPRRNEISLLFNAGAGLLGAPIVTRVACSAADTGFTNCALRDVVAADFDLDGIVDIAAGLSFPESSSVGEFGFTKVDFLRGVGDGSFASPFRVQDFARGTPILGVGNFNNDRFPDVVVATTLDRRVRVLLNATFGLPTPPPGPTTVTGTPRTPTPTPTPTLRPGGQKGDPCDVSRGDSDCNFPLFCASVGSGTEGICCDTPCEGANERCDLPGSEGTCLPTGLPIGEPCTADAQCTSTFCTDGFCCNERCLEENRVCNRVGEEGICGLGQRATPTPGDNRPNGDPCDSPSQCQSGFCPPEDGICCDRACDGPNEVCVQGTCTTTGPKRNGEPCTTAAECQSGFCPPEDGVCCNRACLGPNESCSIPGAEGTCLKENGEPCSSPAECRSGFCPAEDGVCCDTACTGADESCRIPGSEGTCTVAKGPGEPCLAPGECASGFCPPEDLVCCEEACEGPGERCDALGRCVSEAVPTATRIPTRTPTPASGRTDVVVARGKGCSAAGGRSPGAGWVWMLLLPLALRGARRVSPGRATSSRRPGRSRSGRFGLPGRLV